MSGDVDMKDIKENEENKNEEEVKSLDESVKEDNKEIQNEEILKEESIPEESEIKDNEFDKFVDESIQKDNVVKEDKIDNIIDEDINKLEKELEELITKTNEDYPNINNIENDMSDVFKVPIPPEDTISSEDENNFDEFFKTLKDYNNIENYEPDVVKHAKNEFIYAGWMHPDGRFYDNIQGEICNDVLDVITHISKQGHSGNSIQYFMNLLNKLVNYEVLTPLTGEDDEWENPYGFDFMVNKRDSRVIKYMDGTCVFTNGRIFIDSNGNEYLAGRNSHVVIKSFPYIPKSEYVNL